MVELDTNILQTKTVRNIVKVLVKIEKELLMPDNVNAVAEIINRHDVAMSLMKSYRE